MNLRRVILAEDDTAFAAALQAAARGHFDCDHASTAQEFRDLFAPDKYDVSVIDIRLDLDREGLDLVRDVRRMAPNQRVVLVSAFWDSETRLEGLFSGAHQYIDKNRRDIEQIVELVGHEIDKSLLLHALDAHRRLSPPFFLGTSRPIRDLVRKLDDVELRRPRSVLIEGEIGSGVLEAASQLHRSFGGLHPLKPLDLTSYCEGASHAPDSPEYSFVELPGSGPGSPALLAGTAATQASRKTVFLHRRTVSEPAIIGCIDDQAGFSAHVAVPALRDRKEDIGALAAAFLEHEGIGGPVIEPDALATLQRHDWPGNVRELRATIELAAMSMKAQHRTALNAVDLRGLLVAGEATQRYGSYRDHLLICEMRYLEEFMGGSAKMTQVEVARALGYRDIGTMRRHIERAASELGAFSTQFPLLSRRFTSRRDGGR